VHFVEIIRDGRCGDFVEFAVSHAHTAYRHGRRFGQFTLKYLVEYFVYFVLYGVVEFV
jgi:hypothetical protein